MLQSIKSYIKSHEHLYGFCMEVRKVLTILTTTPKLIRKLGYYNDLIRKVLYFTPPYTSTIYISTK